MIVNNHISYDILIKYDKVFDAYLDDKITKSYMLNACKQLFKKLPLTFFKK
jgi:hypothetical protein